MYTIKKSNIFNEIEIIERALFRFLILYTGISSIQLYLTRLNFFVDVSTVKEKSFFNRATIRLHCNVAPLISG